jgi:CHASE2 domain-containing sensor protein/serine phosphatase RsbU (regulator of sigma subunit)
VTRLAEYATALLRARHGRAFPLVLLFIAALALIFQEHTPLVNLRHAQFDHYQQLMPRHRASEPAIVVSVDSQSLERHGQWPWSRELIAQMVNQIMAGQPLALGIDMIFAERDRYSPAVLAERLPALPKSALVGLNEPDSVFAKALSQGPTVLAVVGVARQLPGARQPNKPLPALAESHLAEQPIIRFPAALASRPQLEAAAAGEGLINASPDKLSSSPHRGVLRHTPTIAFIDQQPFLSLPLEMVRVALGEAGSVVPVISRHGMERINVGDYSLPTQPNGELLIHFGQSSSNYHLSAADVIAGVHKPSVFQNRFVLIGFNTTGLQDRVITPLGDNLPGVDIHAQIIESLLSGEALQRPHWMSKIELGILLIAGLLMIAFMSKLRPNIAIFGFIGLVVTLIGIGYFSFRQDQWLFDGTSVAILLSPIFMALLSHILINADAQRRLAQKQLQESREAAARDAGELDAARRIQMGLLPNPAQLFSHENRFSVAALLEPARAVGGDYYDCFMLDEQRLCLAIGDVSGKGIPASLFMAISKALTGTLTRSHADLGAAMRAVEHELDRNNSEYLFVTSFVGVIDVDTGAMEFVCAGHDAPLLRRAGHTLRIDTEPTSGPPLCATGDYPFTTGHTQLQPGDLLCLFTDGVSEAYNGKSMFTGERLAEVFVSTVNEPTLQLQIEAMRDAVRQFEAGFPPADDLTLLLARWYGQPRI